MYSDGGSISMVEGCPNTRTPLQTSSPVWSGMKTWLSSPTGLSNAIPGLKSKVLDVYQELAIAPLLGIFAARRTFDVTVEAVITFMMQDREALGLPNGCLYVTMRSQQHRLGPKTVEKLDLLREQFQKGISDWVADAKTKGQIEKNVPTNVATLFIDAQHAGAMRMQKEDVHTEQIKSFLRFGFAALRS